MRKEVSEFIDLDTERRYKQGPEEPLSPDWISSCFLCRTCVSSCPITFVEPKFSPLGIIRAVLYGFMDEVLSGDLIWLCTSCYSCQERCPQGIRIADFIVRVKNMAVEKGYAPAGVRAQMDLIRKAGKIYPLDDFDNKKRSKAGLPPLPTSCDVIGNLLE